MGGQIWEAKNGRPKTIGQNGWSRALWPDAFSGFRFQKTLL